MELIAALAQHLIQTLEKLRGFCHPLASTDRARLISVCDQDAQALKEEAQAFKRSFLLPAALVQHLMAQPLQFGGKRGIGGKEQRPGQGHIALVQGSVDSL